MTRQRVQPGKSAMSSARPPVRRLNSVTRSLEYLTVEEVRLLEASARGEGRNGFRDSLLIEVMFRHGLRVSEAAALTRDQIHFDEGTLHVVRAKNGTPATHYLDGGEMRRLRRLLRDSSASRFLFCSERGGPLSERTIHNIVKRAGVAAGLAFPVHPHMLRHAKGYQLAQRGTDTRAIQGYLGHRDIKSTVTYTALSPTRFKGFESDD